MEPQELGHPTGMVWPRKAGVELLHVPFRGASDAERAILGGNTTSLWHTAGAPTGGVRSGTLRDLAVTSATRTASVPDWPAIVEAGFPGSVASHQFLLAGPARLPAEIVGRLRAHPSTAMAEPAAIERWAAVGMVGLDDPSPEQMTAFVLAEAERSEPAVRAANA